MGLGGQGLGHEAAQCPQQGPWSSPATQWSRAVMMAAWGLQWELHPAWHLRPGLKTPIFYHLYFLSSYTTPAKSTAPASLLLPVCPPAGAQGPFPCTLIQKVPHTTDLPLLWLPNMPILFLACQSLLPLSDSASQGPKAFKGFSVLPQLSWPGGSDLRQPILVRERFPPGLLVSWPSSTSLPFP